MKTYNSSPNLEANRENTVEIKKYGLNIEVPSSIMIPSSYTDLLATHIPQEKYTYALDLGCGCGALAILLRKANCLNVLATDVNPKALEITKENALKNGVFNKIETIRSDMFTGIKNYKFDLILFNPPSLPSATEKGLTPNFYGGFDGRKFIDILITNSKFFLQPDGKVLYIQNSLTNIKRSILLIEQLGYNYSIICSKKIPFRLEYYTQLDHLKKLQRAGHSEFEEVNGDLYQTIYLVEFS